QNDDAVAGRGERKPSSHATSSICRIPVKLSPDEADGVLTADDIPDADLHDVNVSKGQPVDCTWEIHTDKGHGINLRSSEMDMRNRKRCDNNNITIYERTTLDSAIKGKYCPGSDERFDMTSDSNRVFVRLYGSSITNKPNVKMIYSLVRRGECSETEFPCGDLCLPLSLKCNGVDNCRDRSDERGCSRGRKTKDRTPVDVGSETQGVVKKPINVDGTSQGGSTRESSEDFSILPLHIIILASVGGVIITCVSVSLCVMCLLRKKDREKRQEATRPKTSNRKTPWKWLCATAQIQLYHSPDKTMKVKLRDL
ncbi:unnamed protein product, partial [Candidula unifasciata]